MSDYFQSYVFAEVGVDRRRDFPAVKDYLLAEEIIGKEMAENGLGESGHVPGARASSIIIEDNDYWHGLRDNGVVFGTGRIIEVATGLQSGTCPDCSNDFPVGSEAFLVINAALADYDEGGTGEFLCPHCRRPQHLSDWDFGNRLAVGTAKVTFWNWPDHVPDLDVHFRKLSQMRCTKVWGKL
jgi:hypothetical protein